MREDKLFKAVRNVDDDLICEMMEYSPERNDEGDVSEGVRYSVPEGGRTRRLWRYPVTAAAVLAVVGCALFVIGYNGGIVDKLSAVTGEETGVTAVESDNGEAFTVDNTDKTCEETEPAVTEAVKPSKIVNMDIESGKMYSLDKDFQVFCFDSLPAIPDNALDDGQFTEMTMEELFKYYGLDFMLPKLIDNEKYYEIVDENNVHGIYISPDSTVNDINSFYLIRNENWEQKGIEDTHTYMGFDELTITVGKETKFGEGYKFSSAPFTHNKICYNTEDGSFFVVYDVKDECSVMISAKVSYYVDEATAEVVEKYIERNDGIPPSVEVFRFSLFNLFTTKVYIGEDEWAYKEIDEVTGEERVNRFFDTDETEAAVTQIEPIKTIDVHPYDADKQEGNDETLFQVLCVPSLPTVSENNLGEESFEEMSTEELFKYYGLEYMLEDLKKYHYEEADENTKHGVFTFSDGDVYDINTFVFHINESYVSDGLLDEWERLTVTVGKSTSFGREYAYEHKSFDFDTVCYNEESDTYFMVYDNVDGSCTVMLSGTADELGVGFDNYGEYLKGFAELNGGVSPYAHSICQYAYRWFTDDDSLRYIDQ